jgi:hypothetical protein
MVLSQNAPAALRTGEALKIGRESISFARHILAQRGSTYELQHRLFVNDPWELIAEAIHRAVPNEKRRHIAHSFRRQAEDYFRTATIGRELAVRPVLLYYAFLNLSKAYALTQGSITLLGKAVHGISADPKPRAIISSSIKFDKSNRVGVFQELLRFLGGNPGFASSDVPLGYLLPQILPGHRLWCYATGRVERFFTVQRFDVLHASSTKGVWINIYLDRSDLERVGISESKALADCGCAGEFEIATGIAPKDWTCFQQRTPTPYMSDPAEALAQIMAKMRTNIWETVKIDSPYRKPYVYCCPVGERGARVPQLLSIYLLMFFLGYVTRYTPGYFEDLLDSKFGPLFETFVSESPMQFLYLMASEILGREVSKPAII